MPTSWNKVYHLKLIDQLAIMAAAIQLSELPYGLTNYPIDLWQEFLKMVCGFQLYFMLFY